MEYWQPVAGRNDYVYSCDKMRYALEIKDLKFSQGVLQQLLTAYGRLDVQQYPTNFSDFKYRHMFKIQYDDDCVMAVGIGFNGVKKSDLSIGFLEVNPNKCFGCLQCMYDIQHIFDACWNFNLLRFDLAIDVPLPREMLSLVKDGRKYALDMRSVSNKTEYLGARNASGYIKLYNKSIEQNLSGEDLTRLEMTCSGNWNAEQIISKLPYVFVSSDNFCEDLQHLSATQAVLVRALRSHPDRDELYKSLNPGMRVKLRPYLYDADTTLTYDTDAVCAVLANIRQFEKMMDDRAYLCVSREELQEDAARRTAKRRGSDFVHLTDAEARNNPFDNESKMV